MSARRTAGTSAATTSVVAAPPWGDVEYAQGGSGSPVLVIHGSAGGCDQGELIARTVLDDGHRWIAPSRFGYLRSGLPPGATFDDQAHAYVALLDSLGVERAAVLALSHGGPSALLLAALHPERVTSLTLLSCGVTDADVPGRAAAHRAGALLAAAFRHDLLFGAGVTLFRDRLIALMGADRAVVAGLAPERRALVDEVVDRMSPASPRAAGVAFDHTAALPGERISAVRAPTLIVHARDDRLQLFHNAEFAARTIHGAQLAAFDRGGHLLVAVELDAVRRLLREHLAGPAGSAGDTAARPARRRREAPRPSPVVPSGDRRGVPADTALHRWGTPCCTQATSRSPQRPPRGTGPRTACSPVSPRPTTSTPPSTSSVP